MAQYAADAPTNFEIPAPLFVYAVLVAGALTKVGHPLGRRRAYLASFRNLKGSV
jgi:hypothetical protein